MGRIGYVFAAFLGPGVAQALVGRRRVAIALAAASILAMLGIAVTIDALPVVLGIHAVSVLDMIVWAIRTREARANALPAAIVFAVTLASALVVRTVVAQAFKMPSTSMCPTLQIDDHIFITKLGTAGRGDIIVFRQPCEPDRDYVKRVIALANDTVEVRCDVVYVNGKPLPLELVKADDTYRDSYDGQWSERSSSRYRESHGGHTYDVFHDAEKPARGAAPSQKDFPQELAPDCSRGGFSAVLQRPGRIVDTGEPAEPCAPHRHFVVPTGHVFVMGDNRANSNDSRFWGAVPVENIRGRVSGIWLPVGRFGGVP